MMDAKPGGETTSRCIPLGLPTRLRHQIHESGPSVSDLMLLGESNVLSPQWLWSLALVRGGLETERSILQLSIASETL